MVMKGYMSIRKNNSEDVLEERGSLHVLDARPTSIVAGIDIMACNGYIHKT